MRNADRYSPSSSRKPIVVVEKDVAALGTRKQLREVAVESQSRRVMHVADIFGSSACDHVSDLMKPDIRAPGIERHEAYQAQCSNLASLNALKSGRTASPPVNCASASPIAGECLKP
jgi:hypothetical protein